MLSHSLKYRKNAETKNPRVAKANNPSFTFVTQCFDQNVWFVIVKNKDS